MYDMNNKTPPRGTLPVSNSIGRNKQRNSPSVGDIDKLHSPSKSLNYPDPHTILDSANVRGSFDPTSIYKSQSAESKNDLTYDEIYARDMMNSMTNHRKSISSTQYQDLLRDHQNFMALN